MQGSAWGKISCSDDGWTLLLLKWAVPHEKCSNRHLIMKPAEIPNEQNIHSRKKLRAGVVVSNHDNETVTRTHSHLAIDPSVMHSSTRPSFASCATGSGSRAAFPPTWPKLSHNFKGYGPNYASIRNFGHFQSTSPASAASAATGKGSRPSIPQTWQSTSLSSQVRKQTPGQQRVPSPTLDKAQSTGMAPNSTTTYGPMEAF